MINSLCKKYCVFLKKILIAFFPLFCASALQAQTMKYVSSEVRPVTTGADNAASWQRLQIITAGSGNPLSLIAFHFSKTKNQKGKKVVVYYTGKDSTASSISASASQQNLAGAMLIIGAETLSEGPNYFWIKTDDNVLPDIVSFDLATQDYMQVWADEFNVDTINTANWGFEQGFVRNEEHQWYQKENATCKNGILTIEARREKKANPTYVAGSKDWRKKRETIEYTATSMRTAGKQQWQYGRFEMRARIDTVLGYWPAWWTLGATGRWPANGEIDIMEYYTGKLLANIAVADANPGKAFWYSNTFPVRRLSPTWKDSFHVWRMDWDEQGIGLYLDDVLLNYQPQSRLYNRHDTTSFPFKQPHYMLLNLAIGGMNGGNPDNTTFPLKFEVDYVRVAQKKRDSFSHAGTFAPAKSLAAKAAQKPRRLMVNQ
ncbi:MAG TPA: glycoside hydrolase family 16 protein [Flavisolibacter sp.]